MKPILPLTALLLYLSTAGCALLAPDISLQLLTPELPEWWRERSGGFHYRVEWIDPEGVSRELSCSPGARVGVVLPRLANTPVLLTPVYSTERGPRPLLPGAALYPQDLRGERALEASWIRGFEGRVLLELQRRGYAYFQVNHQRFTQELSQLCGDDPWAAELNRVVRALLEGSFRSSYLAPQEGAAGMRELPPGSYLRDNPLLPPVETVEIDGRSLLVLEEIYPGHHRFFYLHGGAELLLSNDGEHELGWKLFTGN